MSRANTLLLLLVLLQFVFTCTSVLALAVCACMWSFEFRSVCRIQAKKSVVFYRDLSNYSVRERPYSKSFKLKWLHGKESQSLRKSKFNGNMALISSFLLRICFMEYEMCVFSLTVGVRWRSGSEFKMVLKIWYHKTEGDIEKKQVQNATYV